MRNDRDDIDSATRRAEAARAAHAILAGEIGLIEGVRSLTRIGHGLVRDFWGDPDFSVLGAVDSETDDLPVGQARGHWDAAALAVKDGESADYEAAIRDAAL